jgi:DNA-binding transcriptional regulator PaaX
LAAAPAALSARILDALTEMGTPMSLRTIADDIGGDPVALRGAVSALRTEGRIVMHGKGRHAVYSVRDGESHADSAAR